MEEGIVGISDDDDDDDDDDGAVAVSRTSQDGLRRH